MTPDQGSFAARIIDVENTSGPILHHLPEGIRALFGHEVGTTISFGGPRGLDLVGLSPSPQAARQAGEVFLSWRKKFAPWTGFPVFDEYVIRVEKF